MNNQKHFVVQSKRENLVLRVTRGHFATNNSHLNYYIDVTSQKTNLSEARAIADELATYYKPKTIVDTILCLDGTEVIGTCLARNLTRNDFVSVNARRQICILSPEYSSGSQIIFRDNTSSMIKDKHVLILAASVATGKTVLSAVDSVNYYGGNVVGIASIFATVSEIDGIPVTSTFNPADLEGYMSCPSHECPLCKQGIKVEGLVNCHGYSKLQL